MFYSDVHKHVQLHIPKTGGKSLLFIVRSNDHWLRTMPMHVTLPQIELSFPEFVEKFREYEISTVVRNPWSHAVSFYYHAMDENRFMIENFFSIPKFRGLTDEDKLNYDTSFTSFIKNGYSKYRQENYLMDGKILKIDNVFKYEEYDLILDYFVKNYNIKIGEIPRHHDKHKIKLIKEVNLVEDYRELHTKETIDIVGKLSSEIIEKYNYKF